MWTMFLRMMAHAMAQQQGGGAVSDAQLLFALFDKNRAVALKRILAVQFQVAGDAPAGTTTAIGLGVASLTEGRVPAALVDGRLALEEPATVTWTNPRNRYDVNDDGNVRPLEVKTGDRVLFGKYAGTEVKIDGEEHLILREDDILGVVEK